MTIRFVGGAIPHVIVAAVLGIKALSIVANFF
jgi:hypothetical protein